MSLQLRLTMVVSLVVATGLLTAAGAAFAFASHISYQVVQDSIAADARELASSETFLSQVTHKTSGKLARTDRLAQTCYRIVSVVRGFDDPETGASLDWSMPLSEDGLRALKQGQPWSELAIVQDTPVMVYNQPVPVNTRVVGVAQVVHDIGEHAQSLQTLSYGLALGAGALVLLALTAAWQVSGVALRPIVQLARSVRSIEWRRSSRRRIETPARATGEVASLATSLNDLLGGLESSVQQLEHGLESQQRFVADASHELRTPLTTIRGNLGLLRRDGVLTDEEKQAILRDAVDESERMAHLLDELLMLSRAGNARELRREPVDLQALIEDACRKVCTLAPDRVITAYADQVTTLGDADALHQVLLILLDNAVKFTLTGGQISVVVTPYDGRVQIRVRDNGVGIDEVHLPRIFERFYRADPSRPGTGLGLSIARDLVERQGGTISASSRRGLGSIFTLTLPAA